MSEPPANHGLPQRPNSDGQRRAEQDGSGERAQHRRDADQQTNDKQKYDAAFDQRYRAWGIGRLCVTGWINLVVVWATFLDAYAHASPHCSRPAAPECAAPAVLRVQTVAPKSDTAPNFSPGTSFMRASFRRPCSTVAEGLTA